MYSDHCVGNVEPGGIEQMGVYENGWVKLADHFLMTGHLHRILCADGR